MWWSGENSRAILCVLIINVPMLIFSEDSRPHNALAIKGDAWPRMGKRNLLKDFTTSDSKQNANLWHEMEEGADMWARRDDAESENKRSTGTSKEMTDSSSDLQPGMWGKRGQPGASTKRTGGKSWGRVAFRRRQAISNVWQKLIKYIEKRSKLDKEADALATALEGLNSRNHRLPAFLGILKLYTECRMREGISIRPKPNPTEYNEMEHFSNSIERPEWQFFKPDQDN